MKNVIFIPCPSQPDMKTAAETAAERLLEISIVPELHCGTGSLQRRPGKWRSRNNFNFSRRLRRRCPQSRPRIFIATVYGVLYCRTALVFDDTFIYRQLRDRHIGSAGNNQLENRQRPLRGPQNSRCPLLVLSGSGKDYWHWEF